MSMGVVLVHVVVYICMVKVLGMCYILCMQRLSPYDPSSSIVLLYALGSGFWGGAITPLLCISDFGEG